MKELTDRMQMMVIDCNEMRSQMDEFQTGIKEQVESILRQPPPKSLYKSRNTAETKLHIRELYNIDTRTGSTGLATDIGTGITSLTGVPSHGDTSQTQPEISNPPNSPVPLMSFD